jgi:hypothetical protein
MSFLILSTFESIGVKTKTLLVIYLLMLSAGLWMLLRYLVNDLSEDLQTDLVTDLVSTRVMGVWAVICVLVIVPIGAALGSAWGDIRAVVMGGF